jgi:hypothetical protein
MTQKVVDLAEPRAYGRGEHLRGLKKPSGPMLTQERLGEVSWVLGKFSEASRAMEKLLDGEPEMQPPTDRSVAMRQIEAELQRLAEELEALFA